MRLAQRGAALVAAVLVGGGCASVSVSASADRKPSARLASAVRDPILQDIPKPAGFQLAADRSIFWQRGHWRMGKCEYEGPTDPTSVKRFYEQYLPSAGFTLRERSLDNGEYKLRFESETEVCVIRVARKRGRTRVLLEIAPQSRGAAETPQPKVPLRRPG